MKQKRPLPWWENYLGFKIDYKRIARTTWKAYLLYILPPLSLLFAAVFAKEQPTNVDPSPLTDEAPHFPSSTIIFEGPAIPGSPSSVVSINVSDSISMSVDESVTIGKKSDDVLPEPAAGPSPDVITPLTGSMMIAGQGVLVSDQSTS